MKKAIILILLIIGINSFSQNAGEKPLIPAIHVNSLDLNTTIKSGKEFFSFIEQKKTLENREYLILVRKKKEKSKSYEYQKNNEGNDIPNYGLKGVSTSTYLKGFFHAGYKNGLWKTTHKNKLVKTINYNKGLVIGKYRVYNTKGELLYKTTFGTLGNGKYKDYHYKTGVLKEEGNYENGKKEGEWCTYNKQGNIKEIVTYKKGISIP